MAKVVRGIVGAVSLAVTIFIVLVVFGVFTALDAAPSYTLGTSDETANQSTTSGLTGSHLPLRSLTGFAEDSETGSASVSGLLQGYTEGETPLSVLGTSASGSTSGSGSTAGAANGSTGSASSGSSTKPNTSSSAGGTSSSSGNGSSSSGASNPPQTTTPEKTYYPAWDEWVVEGHYETVTYPATYGERAVYGSLCNTCGVNVSGSAAAHLKATHHSGYHEGVIGYESYQITPERTEQVWVDTSHSVHHPAEWR